MLRIYEAQVPEQWLDYNGHMNDASYAIAFSHAVDRLMDHVGIDADYRQRTQHTIYTLEIHINYVLEAKLGDGLYATVQLLQHDSKRLRVFFRLYREREDALLATSEQMLLHVDQTGPKAAPFAGEVAERVEQLAREQVDLPMPEQAGSAIRTLK